MEPEDKQIVGINEDKIRRHYDPESRQWYFSVVDVIGAFTQTQDPRNYWKTQKNRLKKAQNKLVTECNQLKMRASDGKFYMTDVGNRDTIIELLKLISIEGAEKFEGWVEGLPRHEQASHSGLSTGESDNAEKTDAELAVDLFQKDKNFIVQAFVAGVAPEKLFVTLSYENLIISGERKIKNSNVEKNYLKEELFWGTFSRNIKLPFLVEINKVEATLEHGLLFIKLEK